MGVGEDKKRVANARSPDRSTDDVAQHRRVKGRGDWASSGGLDDVESALPETLDLSGRTDVSSTAIRILLDAQPKTSILKLDGCLGLGDDSMDIINSVLGVHVTELSLVGCTQLKGDALMLNFHKKFPCLHTLNVRGCQIENKDKALMIVSRTICGLPRIEIRS